MTPPVMNVLDRAASSLGTSDNAILNRVQAGLKARQVCGGSLIDLGCGRGDLYRALATTFDNYLGVDVVGYDNWPTDVPFLSTDLNSDCFELESCSADIVAAVELIEHLENPRALIRTMTRLVRPGGWIVVTTPNQLSLLSKLSLLISNQFPAFKTRPGLYPSHITALLSEDLVRIATECGLVNVAVTYSEQGRIPGTGRHFARLFSRLFPRALSDNVILFARKPTEVPE
jgi:SAM-dependent methyltransferase